MMVEVKKPLNEEHHQKTAQYPGHRAIYRTQFMPGMREQMQHPHPQHQTGHETGRYLEPQMGQSDQKGNPTAGQGSQEDE